MNITPTAPAPAPVSTSPTIPLLPIAERDSMIDHVLTTLAAMAPADRTSLLEGIVATLDGMSPKGVELLCHRARRTFWLSCLDLACLDAGRPPEGSAYPTGRKLTRAALRRHMEQRAWSAATVLPLRSFLDVLPRSLHDIADGLARAVSASQAAPLSPPARVSPH